MSHRGRARREAHSGSRPAFVTATSTRSGSGLVIPHAAIAFLAVAAVAVVTGGAVAAVTAPLELEHGSWAAAYLVLVVGVGQAILGIGQAATSAEPPSQRRIVLELGLFELSSAAVLLGTAASSPVTVTIGSALLVLALLAFAGPALGGRAGIVRLLYLAMLAVLLVSIPIGVALSWARS